MRYPLLFVVLSLAAVAGCGVPLKSTSALIVRYEPHQSAGHALRACRITLGWTKDELVAACGKPDAQIGHARLLGVSCYAWRSFAHSIGTTDAVAPVMVACLSREQVYRSRDPNSRQGRESMDADVVTEVYGLSRMPDDPIHVSSPADCREPAPAAPPPFVSPQPAPPVQPVWPAPPAMPTDMAPGLKPVGQSP